MSPETLSAMTARLAELEAETAILRANKPARERVRPIDPEAKSLAADAQTLARAANLRSGYVQPDARAFLDEYIVTPDGDDHVIVTHGDESQRISIDDIEALAAGARPSEGYASLKTLTTERLYLRKLSIFLVVALARLADEQEQNTGAADGSDDPTVPENAGTENGEQDADES